MADELNNGMSSQQVQAAIEDGIPADLLTKERSVLTVPMREEPWQRNQLDKLMDSGHQIKKQLIADRKRALEQMERTKEWRDVQRELKAAYTAFDEEHPKSEEKNNPDAYERARKKLNSGLKPLYTRRNKMLVKYGFSQNAFEKRILKFARRYKRRKRGAKHSKMPKKVKLYYLVPPQATQKIADSVWDMFSSYLFGKGKAIRFPSWTEFKSIFGKTNDTGIVFVKDESRYWESYLIVNDMRISLNIDPPKKDVYGYQQEALSRRVIYAGVTRRWYSDGWRYFATLLLDGPAPVKRYYDGELLHPLGEGKVGHDIGTQTMASCGDKDVSLYELADRVKGIDRELRILNRAMDRSRRAMNPDMFGKDGQIIPINRLPADKLTKHGKRKWIKSKRYCQLESERRSLYREQKEMRIRQHNELCNKLLAYGDDHYIETMKFSALAKRCKETKKTANGKFKSKKRFGKSVSNKATALCVAILERKVLAAGGRFHYINTYKAKASQYDHIAFEYTKKSLSKRWNDIGSHKVQRDLYSAFLIQNTNETLDGFIQKALEAGFANFLALHDKEIERLREVCMPSSAGIACCK